MTAPRLGFFWPWPEDEEWTDEAAASLVGQEVPISFFGFRDGRVKIIEATNDTERKGLRVLIERVEESPPRKIAGIVEPGMPEEIESGRIDPDRLKAHIEAIAAQEGVEVPDEITVQVVRHNFHPWKWVVRWEFDVPG